MNVLVFEDAIAGITEQLDNLPVGFTAVEAPDLPLEQLYWDGAIVRIKPEQPSSLHVWEVDQWVLPQPNVFGENWQGLTEILTGSGFWTKAYDASTRTLKANSAFTVLLAVLTSTQRVDRLANALALLRGAMIGIGAIGDFTPDELEEIAQILRDNGFNPEEFEL
ncbi:MAG: hypothetical protein HC781_01595 [Leptolyngbyaceae cyanobacterium CSU_1_4]|nr:hypothetical protein [Leptolyngbyaceae cyanobacterium CSU_1_4]